MPKATEPDLQRKISWCLAVNWSLAPLANAVLCTPHFLSCIYLVLSKIHHVRATTQLWDEHQNLYKACIHDSLFIRLANTKSRDVFYSIPPIPSRSFRSITEYQEGQRKLRSAVRNRAKSHSRAPPIFLKPKPNPQPTQNQKSTNPILRVHSQEQLPGSSSSVAPVPQSEPSSPSSHP